MEGLRVAGEALQTQSKGFLGLKKQQRPLERLLQLHQRVSLTAQLKHLKSRPDHCRHRPVLTQVLTLSGPFEHFTMDPSELTPDNSGSGGRAQLINTLCENCGEFPLGPSVIMMPLDE